MKKTMIISAILVVITMTTGFSNSRSIAKETREVSDFSKINFGVSGNLYISFGSDFKVVLEGEQDLLDDIITEVSGGKLVIKKDNWRFSMNDKVTVYITMPEIKGLGVSGSGKAEIKDAVKTGNIDLSVSGSGKILTTDVVATDMKCSISGSGDIIFGGSGNVSRADISISGSGSYIGEPLKIEDAEISISGSGSCSCNASESLTAHVSGSGNVTYLGNPKVDARVSGSGRIRSK
jgi:hypothetical protein